MKEIIAILRPGKDRETKKALERIGCMTFTSVRVRGRGKQRGLRYSTLVSDSDAPQFIIMKYLPKKMLYMVVTERQLRPAIQTIIRVNRTEQYGDGKIFVLEMKDARRIRTGEKGDSAIQ